MHRVFVCRDPVHERLLEGVVRNLEADGVTISRGPMAPKRGRLRYTPDMIKEHLSSVEVGVFTIRHDIDLTLLKSVPQMHGICLPTIGVESVDLAATEAQGVIVGHGATPGNVIGIAEATLMLILNLAYDLRKSEQVMKENLRKPVPPVASQLLGKTVGIIGFGRIARALAERLAPFGVEIVTYSPRTPTDSLPGIARKVDLNELMAVSDFVSVLVSITPESRGMIGVEELKLMKPSAFFINTGRGEAVDEAALTQLLQANRIAGAALDTFAQEPLALDSPLRELPNVILTPHMVGQTLECAEELEQTLTDNVLNILNGKLPVYCKNPNTEPAWRKKLAQLGKRNSGP